MNGSSEIKERRVSPVYHVILLFALTDSNLGGGRDSESKDLTLQRVPPPTFPPHLQNCGNIEMIGGVVSQMDPWFLLVSTISTLALAI